MPIMTATYTNAASGDLNRLNLTLIFCKILVRKGSYGEDWSLRKVLRRFIWHDRIHAKAMYRMATKVFGAESIVNPFYFFEEGVLT